jgi:hypothetical protein
LETNVSDIRGTLLNVAQKVEQLEQKVQGVAQKGDTGFQEIGETTHGILAMISERFDKAEATMHAGFARRLQEHDALRDRLRLLETRVDTLEAVHR